MFERQGSNTAALNFIKIITLPVKVFQRLHPLLPGCHLKDISVSLTAFPINIWLQKIPDFGQSIKGTAMLGNQWNVGDWQSWKEALGKALFHTSPKILLSYSE